MIRSAKRALALALMLAPVSGQPTPLHEAIGDGDEAAVATLLATGADPDDHESGR